MKKIITTLNDLAIFKSFRAIDLGDTTKGISNLNGVTVNEIKEFTNLSEKKIRDTIKLGIENGLIEQGIMHVRTKTYYLTEQGLNEIFKIINIDTSKYIPPQDDEDDEDDAEEEEYQENENNINVDNGEDL